MAQTRDEAENGTAASGWFGLPRAVWLLGWVSLATDAATEAIYPLMPFFLTQVLGAGAVSIGVIEGAAEAVNSLLKLWAGRASDRMARKRPMVFAGYAISSLLRPLVAIAAHLESRVTVAIASRGRVGCPMATGQVRLSPDTRMFPWAA